MSGSALLVASFLLGGVPFGWLIARIFAGIDVREHGSGNIGATNVYRVVGKPAGAMVFVLDVAKGLVPPLVGAAWGLSVPWQVGAGLAAVVGHSYSPFLRFRGGKGGATSFGVLLGVSWPVGVGAVVIWTLVVGVTGYVSLGTMTAAVGLTPMTLFFYPGDAPRLALVVLAALLTIFRHRSNICRLVAGTEYNFRRKDAERAQ
jgi:acyl phosphate:glycerol-3-phosphate acyltransferase